jgi:putative FmdB family regulatory protein
MPLFDIHCHACQYRGEVLVVTSAEDLLCPACGSTRTEKLMSAPSTLTGNRRHTNPGVRDHGCCGSRPSEAGCAGPGSCCGRLGSG